MGQQQLAAPRYSPQTVKLEQRFDAMARENQTFRAVGRLDYAPRSAAADRRHRPELLRIYKKYGWPTWDLVGKQAGDQFWLLVQHQDLALQQQMFPAMERGDEGRSGVHARFLAALRQDSGISRQLAALRQ